jgi:hypothetical protein
MPKRQFSFYIAIDEPCREDWGKMSPCNAGRFCSSCLKTVVDYRHKTNSEIFQSLSHDNRNGCGLFYEDQLQAVYAAPSRYNRLTLRPYLLAIGCLSAGPGQRSFASAPQMKLKADLFSVQKQVSQGSATFGKKDSTGYWVISGVVMKKRGGELLKNVEVSVKGVNVNTFTNDNGEYYLEIPKASCTGKKLEIRYRTYEYFEARHYIKLSGNMTKNVKMWKKDVNLYMDFGNGRRHRYGRWRKLTFPSV